MLLKLKSVAGAQSRVGDLLKIQSSLSFRFEGGGGRGWRRGGRAMQCFFACRGPARRNLL